MVIIKFVAQSIGYKIASLSIVMDKTIPDF